MNSRRFLMFLAKVVAAQVTTYFVAGAVFYQFLTKPYYVGPNPVFAVFLRTELDHALWPHVVNWFLPAEILRGTLFALVFYPLYDTLGPWPFVRRFLYIASLYLVLSFWGAGGPSPGTIEGMVYLRPFITPEVHLRVQPEMILQGLGMALFIAGAMMDSPRKMADRAAP